MHIFIFTLSMILYTYGAILSTVCGFTIFQFAGSLLLLRGPRESSLSRGGASGSPGLQINLPIIPALGGVLCCLHGLPRNTQSLLEDRGRHLLYRACLGVSESLIMQQFSFCTVMCACD